MLTRKRRVVPYCHVQVGELSCYFLSSWPSMPRLATSQLPALGGFVAGVVWAALRLLPGGEAASLHVVRQRCERYTTAITSPVHQHFSNKIVCSG